MEGFVMTKFNGLVSAVFICIALSQFCLSTDAPTNNLCFKSYKGNDRCRRPMMASASTIAACCARQRAQGYAEVSDKDMRLGFKCKPCTNAPNGDGDKAVDGGWSSWSPWSSCSFTCGKDSVRTRIRSCTNPVPRFNGKSCGSDYAETKACTIAQCPVDGVWSEWSKFSDCSVSCSLGVRKRVRRCDSPATAFGGKPCIGESSHSVECTMPPCPIDGQWNSWGLWSRCSASCDMGIQQRWRACNDPPPKFGGNFCVGNQAEVKNCTARIKCPVHGEWSSWSSWSNCYSSKCETGFGLTVGQRSCNSPTPRYKGQMCQGVFIRDATCTEPINCDIQGEWAAWASWQCINDGIIQRTRTCKYEEDPSGVRKKKPCQGDDTSTKLASDSELDAQLVKQFCQSSQIDNEPLVDFGSGSGSGSGSGFGSGFGSGSGDGGDQED